MRTDERGLPLTTGSDAAVVNYDYASDAYNLTVEAGT
jgi:hypothetical protein